VNQQNVALGVWLGIPVLALGWANLKIWQTRRALNRARQVGGVQHLGSTPCPTFAELASPVMAR